MITNAMIAWGDLLGAQMTTYANLYYIAKENGQELVFFEELKNFRRGYQILDVFEMENFHLLKNTSLVSKLYNMQFEKKDNWKKQMRRMYGSRVLNKVDALFAKYVLRKYRFKVIKNLDNAVHCNAQLLNLDKDVDYDIRCGFGTIQDWKKYGEEIKAQFIFKSEVINEGNKKWEKMHLNDLDTVGVHFRRTDYLIMSSLNLSEKYYEKAMKLFPEKSTFVVFSDDIEEVKNMELFRTRKNVIFMEANSQAVDMYLMTLCSNLIIANSSFSFWGGYLNGNKEKKVVCPHDFIGKDCKEFLYMNGNWYPDDWIAI